MSTRFFISLRNAFSEYASRYKAIADAKYAFKNFDLRSDVNTVVRRYKAKNGNTIGAEFRRKYPMANNLLPIRSFGGSCMDESLAEQLHQLYKQA